MVVNQSQVAQSQIQSQVVAKEIARRYHWQKLTLGASPQRIQSLLQTQVVGVVVAAAAAQVQAKATRATATCQNRAKARVGGALAIRPSLAKAKVGALAIPQSLAKARVEVLAIIHPSLVKARAVLVITTSVKSKA